MWLSLWFFLFGTNFLLLKLTLKLGRSLSTNYKAGYSWLSENIKRSHWKEGKLPWGQGFLSVSFTAISIVPRPVSFMWEKLIRYLLSEWSHPVIIGSYFFFFNYFRMHLELSEILRSPRRNKVWRERWCSSFVILKMLDHTTKRFWTTVDVLTY